MASAAASPWRRRRAAGRSSPWVSSGPISTITPASSWPSVKARAGLGPVPSECADRCRTPHAPIWISAALAGTRGRGTVRITGGAPGPSNVATRTADMLTAYSGLLEGIQIAHAKVSDILNVPRDEREAMDQRGRRPISRRSGHRLPRRPNPSPGQSNRLVDRENAITHPSDETNQPAFQLCGEARILRPDARSTPRFSSPSTITLVCNSDCVVDKAHRLT